MRGRPNPQRSMMAIVDLEERVPQDHPLRCLSRTTIRVTCRGFHAPQKGAAVPNRPGRPGWPGSTGRSKAPNKVSANRDCGRCSPKPFLQRPVREFCGSNTTYKLL